MLVLAHLAGDLPATFRLALLSLRVLGSYLRLSLILSCLLDEQQCCLQRSIHKTTQGVNTRPRDNSLLTLVVTILSCSHPMPVSIQGKHLRLSLCLTFPQLCTFQGIDPRSSAPQSCIAFNGRLSKAYLRLVPMPGLETVGPIPATMSGFRFTRFPSGTVFSI